MLNSETLEVAIGMAFLFLLMSLICAGVKEWLEGIFKWRAMDLERAVRTLLNDSDGKFTSLIYSHPLVSALFQGNYEPSQLKSSPLTPGAGALHVRLRSRRNLPSYLPAANFAKAFMDLVARGPVPAVEDSSQSAQSVDIEMLRERASELPSSHLRRAMLSAIDHASGDLEKVRLNIQDWFDSAMDRASGWYKRRTQAVLFILGLAVATALNVDALHVMERLTTDKVLRALVVQSALSAKGADGDSTDSVAKRAQAAQSELNRLGMPVGWNGIAAKLPGTDISLRIPRQLCMVDVDPCMQRKDNFPTWLRVITGWLITALAVMLGAPFWFDVLNKFMVIRSTVKPKEKSPEEGSEDRASEARPER